MNDLEHIDNNSIKHFGVCFILSCFGLIGASCALGAAITKEYCDNLYVKHWCWWDIVADGLGIIFGLLINYLIF